MIVFNGFKLDDSIKFDEEVNVSWYCSDIKGVFCCNFLGYAPSVKNLRSGAYELYTLSDMWAKNLVIDIPTATIESNGLTIVDDFLNDIKNLLINTNQYHAFIIRYDEIRSYLYFRFKTNWDVNLVNLFKLSDTYDTTNNSNRICSDIIERMIINVPERFQSMILNGIVELPFVVGDYFYVIYTINYLNKTKKYKISINLI